MNRTCVFSLLVCCAFTDKIKGILNPMSMYTPLNTITQYQASIPSSMPTATSYTAPTAPTTVATSSGQNNTTSLSVTTPQTIETAGIYHIDSSANVTGNNCPLTVSKSNVVIDLGDKTIQYAGISSEEINGITINANLTNVKIRNGTLKDFPGAGIRIKGTIEQPISTITLENIKIIGCREGIRATGVTNLFIHNATTSCNQNSVGATSGITLIDCDGVMLQQCFSQQNASTLGECYGYSLTRCTNSILNCCLAVGNKGKGKTVGISFTSMGTNNYIQNCVCSGNQSEEDESSGILINSTQETFVQESISQSNVSNSAEHCSYGILLTNAAHIFLKHNTIDNNDYGIYDDESNSNASNLFIQNNACHNRISDYARPFSFPLPFIEIQQENLKKMLSVGSLDNISIRLNN